MFMETLLVLSFLLKHYSILLTKPEKEGFPTIIFSQKSGVVTGCLQNPKRRKESL